MFLLHRGVFVQVLEIVHHFLQLLKLIGQLLDFSVCLAFSLIRRIIIVTLQDFVTL